MGKVAAIQLCSSGNVKENLEKTAELIAIAAQNKAELVVLPEMFCHVDSDEQEKLRIKEREGDGPIQQFLAQQAQKYSIWIVGGTIPLAAADEGHVRSACLVYNHLGQVVARYDKIHLFDVELSAGEVYKESAVIEAGSKPILVETPLGKMGLAICYDVRFPRLFNYLLNQGADFFAIPTAFTVKTGQAHWHVLTRCRAIENLTYVVAACQGGQHFCGRNTYGHSLIIDPWGTVIEELAHDKPGLICANIDLQHSHNLRKSMPIKEHQKKRFL